MMVMQEQGMCGGHVLQDGRADGGGEEEEGKKEEKEEIDGPEGREEIERWMVKGGGVGDEKHGRSRRRDWASEKGWDLESISAVSSTPSSSAGVARAITMPVGLIVGWMGWKKGLGGASGRGGTTTALKATGLIWMILLGIYMLSLTPCSSVMRCGLGAFGRGDRAPGDGGGSSSSSSGGGSEASNPYPDTGSNTDTPSTRLNVFQVYQPPAPPTSPPSEKCRTTVELMHHTFANSYNEPFIGTYHPPRPPASHCHHSLDSVTMTLTVTSAGRQFDRLALMFLGGVEIFRTSTAEPTVQGIVWSYTKDMSAYLSLWRKEQGQDLVFDLGNLVNDLYTASFEARVTATFAFADRGADQEADLILPISKRRESAVRESAAFFLPSDEASVLHSFPANMERAIVSVSACGQAAEEFWYSNVFSTDTETFVNTTGSLYGLSPFREVQILIDGFLAGVAWPFPIIFTGGIAPGFWRPIVGIDAFDLREPEIDVTTWIPWLSDGKEHRLEIRVVGLDGGSGDAMLSDGVRDYWVVTGKVLVFLADDGASPKKVANHQLPSIFTPYPDISVVSRTTKSSAGKNETLWNSVTVARSIVITSETGSWVQSLEYSNQNYLTSAGLTQSTVQHTEAHSTMVNFYEPRLSFSVSSFYPLAVNTTIGIFDDGKGISIDASLSRGLVIDSTGRPDRSLFTLHAGSSKLETRQSGMAGYSNQQNGSYSVGETTQDFLQKSRQGVSIVHVEAVNGSVALEDGAVGRTAQPARTSFLDRTLRQTVGRGPSRAGGMPLS